MSICTIALPSNNVLSLNNQVLVISQLINNNLYRLIIVAYNRHNRSTPDKTSLHTHKDLGEIKGESTSEMMHA